MAKIMEQPIVDFLRQQLNFSGFPLPSVSCGVFKTVNRIIRSRIIVLCSLYKIKSI